MVALEAQKAPVSEVDPFCREFFENPFPAYEELREAGPVVRLPRYDVWAVARYADVHGVLNDWQTFCSSRGVGLSDFAKEKPWRPKSLLLETDPPLHDRTRRVLNRVLSASAMARLRERFAREADALIGELVESGSFDAVTDLAEAYPLTVFPDAMGMPRENRHFLLPYGNMAFNAFGPRNEFFEAAFAEAEPVSAWLQRQMQREAFAPGGFGAAIYAAADNGELTQEEAPIVTRSIAWPASPNSSTVCAPILHWRVRHSRKRCATRPQCRLSSAPPPDRSSSVVLRSAKGKKC
jgi:cytochrome P450